MAPGAFRASAINLTVVIHVHGRVSVPAVVGPLSPVRSFPAATRRIAARKCSPHASLRTRFRVVLAVRAVGSARRSAGDMSQ